MAHTAFMDVLSAEALQTRHGLPGLAEVIAGQGGLTKVRITAPAAQGEIYLHGAHVTSWQPAGSEEVLFLSQHSRWQPDQAIRGGIPICFPWFRAKDDDPAAPKHGFARTAAWQLDRIQPAGGGVTVALSTAQSSESERWWTHPFQLHYEVTFGAELRLALTFINKDSVPVTIAEALHTYHAVGDVTQVRVAGLDGVHYLDNMDGNREKQQRGDLRFSGETDNAYLNTTTPLTIHDPVLRRQVRIEKTGSSSTVTWNPWEKSARAMSDLGNEEWRRFAAVEASNVLACSVVVPSGASHLLGAVIRVLPE
jgi:glucose-6-phosphate 1-epimerase